MGGRASRDKGSRFEREIVNTLRAAGIAAERVPLSGAAQGSFGGDVRVMIRDSVKTLEAKKRANGFATIEGWLANHYGLVIARDRGEPLVVIRLADFAELSKPVTPLFKKAGAA